MKRSNITNLKILITLQIFNRLNIIILKTKTNHKLKEIELHNKKSMNQYKIKIIIKNLNQIINCLIKSNHLLTKYKTSKKIYKKLIKTNKNYLKGVVFQWRIKIIFNLIIRCFKSLHRINLKT